MEGRAASRSRQWLFGGAISTCLLLAWVMLAGGGTAAGSAAPAAVATDVPTVTATVTVYTTIPIYTPVPVYETTVLTVPVTTSITKTILVTNTAVPPAGAPLPGRTVTLPVPTVLTSNGTVTRVAPNTLAPIKGPPGVITTLPGPTVTTTSTGAAIRISSSPTISKLRFAAGTAGVAVTSAAGFGFLLLRRRGRYGL